MGCLVLRRRNENERSREGRRAKREEKKKKERGNGPPRRGRKRKRNRAGGGGYAELWQEGQRERERKGRRCTGSNAAKLAASGAMVCGAVKYKPEGEEGQEEEEEKKEEEEEEMKEEWNERGESPLSRARAYVPRERRCMGRLKCDMRSSLTYKLNVTVVGVSSSLATTAKPRRSGSLFHPSWPYE